MRVLFIIESLGRGGAERQLVTLGAGLAARGHEVHIGCLREPGSLGAEALEAGLVVHAPRVRAVPALSSLVFLVRLTRRLKPDVLHPYLTQNNVKVSLLRRFYRGTSIVWGVRATSLNLGDYGIKDRLIASLARRLAPTVGMAICNSTVARDQLVEFGLERERVHVVPNGIDTVRFRPRPSSGQVFRERHLSGYGGQVVGMLARWDPMKGQGVFLDMAALLAKRLPECMFVLVGRHTSDQAEAYLVKARSLGLGDRLVLVAEVENSEEALNSLNVLVSCSQYGEGFPNVIAEAMACGVPVVATDVGEAGRILGDFGTVVPAGDVGALAEATRRLLVVDSESKEELRERVVNDFSVDNLADTTQNLLSSLKR